MALKVTQVTPINKVPTQPVTASQTVINQSDKLLALENKIRFLENDTLAKEVYGKELIDKFRKLIDDIGWAIINDEHLVNNSKLDYR